MLHTRQVAIVSLLVLAVPASAQHGKEQLGMNYGWWSFMQQTRFVDVALADLDGDGDLDLSLIGDGWVGSEDWITTLNDGRGLFGPLPRWGIGFLGSGAWQAIGRLNADRVDDIVLMPGSGALGGPEVGLSTGPHAWNWVPIAMNPSASEIRFGDLDGDGDQDLFVAATPIEIWRNDAGTFTEVAGSLLGQVTSTRLAVGDVNGDGALDVFTTNALYLQRNTGKFRLSGSVPGYSYSRPMILTDVDRDGDLDLLGTGLLLLNNGGSFADASARMPGGAGRLDAIDDFDGDGLADVMVAGVVFLNDGRGYFAASPNLRLPEPALTHSSLSVATGDVNGDGKADVVTGSDGRRQTTSSTWGIVKAHVSNNGTFVDTTPTDLPPYESDTRGAVAGDVDGDGDMDLLIFRGGGAPSELLRNDGTGKFLSEDLGWWVATPTEGKQVLLPNRPVLKDLDGDGDLDLVTAGHWPMYGPVPIAVGINDGNGRFLAEARITPPQNANSVAAVDVDGDGDQDLIAVTQGQNRVLRNDGHGYFSELAGAFPLAGDESLVVEAADFDGDGDPDVFVANGALAQGPGPGQDELYLNDGSGHFQLASGALPNRNTSTIWAVAADLNGDGALDLLTNGYCCWNDGTGILRDAPLQSPWGHILVPADLDQDGDLDVVSAGGVFENDGLGGFSSSSGYQDAAAAVVVGDWDGDGDPDWFVGLFEANDVGAPPEIDLLAWNDHRDLWAPRMLLTGQVFPLDLVAEPSQLDRAAVLLLGQRAASPLPTPFGRLFLDPSAILDVGGAALLQGTRSHRFSLPVPGDSALVGFEAGFQAVVLTVGVSGPLELTNAVFERVLF